MVTVLVTIGDWVVKDRGHKILKYYASHLRCPKGESYGLIAWSPNDAFPQCYGCNTSVPDEIQVIIRFLIGA